MPQLKTITVALCLFGVLASPAVAQSIPSSDPAATSPSGATYEIPVDSARGDAAPTGRASRPGSGGGSTPSSAPASTLRSENGFGSTSQVPGTDGASSGAGDAGEDSGRGSGTSDGDGAAGEGSTGPALASTGDSGPSGMRAGFLLGLAGLLGGGLGVAARIAARGRHSSSPNAA